MSKIICDVCGTSFPETANQCPICGCAASADNLVINTPKEDNENGHGSYTHVKGGRFSKTNVKKRNSGRHVAVESKKESAPAKEKDPKKSDRGLVIACIALLLAIIAVIIYIAFRFFIPMSQQTPEKNPPANDVVIENDTNQEEEEEEMIPCTALTLSEIAMELTEENQTVKLEVTVGPENTTDVLSFASADETVATVDEEGNITAVAVGETVINVTCGEMTATCQVTCNFESTTGEEEETENTEDAEQTDTEVTGEGSNHLLENGTYKLNTYKSLPDFTLNFPATHELRLYDAEGNEVDVTITSRGTHVCAVEGNLVKSVGKGYCTLIIQFGEGENDFIICEVRVV